MAAYIDQVATVESLNAMKPFLRDRGQVQLLRRIMNHIGKIPAADVVPVVHGRWLPCGFGKQIMCSVCRCELNDVWEYRHCPDCGSRMDGE
jgi:hypothetical protein